MKSNVLSQSGLAGVLLLVSATAASAQEATAAFTNGYWNLETSVSARNYTVVRFYSPQHALVYEERLPDLCLDLSRGSRLCRRTARRLDVALNQVLLDPAAATQTTQLLARQLGQNRRVQRVYAVR